ncbi:hypothetical protein [Cytobacillus oceanisediminis]|uniref:hypothetical protein n=1 Tax=Cytobacillus oceanisediminis TaxID=665099 RepID=UPI00207A6A8C|nr:hypothetical protein [Cytobacillus oceanisediminis]USK45814.1 hypothetical protein LIT27_08180 [Cytobacillus oceanisediminis]
MKRKPAISFQEKMSWIRHESQFQRKIIEIELRAKKLDEMLERNNKKVVQND